MAEQQEEGWPLGLQPLNIGAGMVRNHDFSGSISFNTLLTGSPSSSTASSSNLDTESTGSFFHDESITLGRLIGVSSILDLSRRSARVRKAEPLPLRSKKKSRSRGWFFSLCSRTDNAKNGPSLGHFLEEERRASNDYWSNQNSMVYDPNDVTDYEPNSLFINGHIAPPQSSPWLRSNVGGRPKRSLAHVNGFGVPVICPCLCGQPTN
ncbi:hypothetical protein AQUCO_02700343v1 [Aquilegia coerulea]|uniref:Uncharacterized protein n=1 Tax=Aquilegia coerulea TaxID=218851 RepID=A0A2G5D6F3_AQUCA|nr:hypothetical protein AQUCO_02700343v1 [Aquilegia coerulea]